MNISIQVQTVKETSTGTLAVITEYGSIVQDVEFVTQRFDHPGQLSFSCVEESGAGIAEGNPVMFAIDGKTLFKGYVFTVSQGRDGNISYVAYDQLRYLKANASYEFVAVSLEQIIKQIAADFGLTVGILEPTGYTFPYLYEEDVSCLDIIFNALSEAIRMTGKIFVFYDKAGELTLTEAKNLFVNTLIGNGSLATDYTYKRDINADTYNRIKLVRPNSNTGKADVYTHEDTETIKKWGLLQYYDQVDEGMNEAQIDEMCRLYLAYYNRVLQTLSIEAIGVTEIRAGSIIPVCFTNIKDLETCRLLLVEKASHNFEGETHTMSIEVKNFSQLGGMMVV